MLLVPDIRKAIWFKMHTHTVTLLQNTSVEYPMASGYCSFPLFPSPPSSFQKQKRRYLTFIEQVKNCDEPTHWKRSWCWERVRAEGEGGDRRWDGWMASLTQWTWVWAKSGRWWRTGKPGMVQSMESLRLRHDSETEQQLILLSRFHLVQKQSDSERLKQLFQQWNQKLNSDISKFKALTFPTKPVSFLQSR